MLIGVRNSAIVLFFEVIIRQVRIAAAPQPELFDELLAFLAGVQLQKSGALGRRNDVYHIFIEPLLVLGIELFKSLAHFLFLLFGEFLGSRRSRRVGRLRCGSFWLLR